MTHQAAPEAAKAETAEIFNSLCTDEALAARLDVDLGSVMVGGHLPDDAEISVMRDNGAVKHVHVRGAPLPSFWHFETAACPAHKAKRRQRASSRALV